MVCLLRNGSGWEIRSRRAELDLEALDAHGAVSSILTHCANLEPLRRSVQRFSPKGGEPGGLTGKRKGDERQ